MKRTCLFHISGNQFPPFPATHHTRRIWEELAQGFDEYHVIARGERNCYTHSVEGKIHLHLLPACGRRMWVFAFLSWVLPWFVLRYRPSHLLAQCPALGGLAAAFCAKIFGLPLFVELHGAHYFGSARPGWRGTLEFVVYRAVSRLTFAAADQIRTLSDDMSGHLLAVYGARLKNKIVTIPTRVDLTVFNTTKIDYAVGAMLRVITVGTFSATKNHCQLIKDLHNSGVQFCLTLVGSGALVAEYRRIANQLGIADRVIIAGRVGHKELSSLLIAHDVYVHYSVSEGLSRAILEAMASGLPVVATRVGFIHGVLENDANALILDPPWSSQLETAIHRLIESKSLRMRLGVAARRTIEERFEWNHVFKCYRNAILAL